MGSLGWADRAESPGRTRQLEFWGQSVGGERAAESRLWDELSPSSVVSWVWSSINLGGNYSGVGKESGLFAVQTPFQTSFPEENAAIASTSKTCRKVRVPRTAVSQYYSTLTVIPFWLLVNFPKMQVINLLAGDRAKSVQFVSQRILLGLPSTVLQVAGWSQPAMLTSNMPPGPQTQAAK